MKVKAIRRFRWDAQVRIRSPDADNVNTSKLVRALRDVETLEPLNPPDLMPFTA